MEISDHLVRDNFTVFGHDAQFNTSSTWVGPCNLLERSVFLGMKQIYVLIILAVVVTGLLLNGLMLVAMSRTKKITVSIRIPTCTCLCSYIIFLLMLAAGCIMGLLGAKNDWISSIGTQIGRFCIAISYLMLTLMLLDRIYCFYKPFLYVRVATFHVASVTTATAILFVIIIKILFRYIAIPYWIEGRQTQMCDISRDLPLLTSIFGFCLVFNIPSCVAILVLVRRYSRRINATTYSRDGNGSRFTHTMGVLTVGSAFILINVVLLILRLIFEMNVSEALRNTMFISHQIMCFVDPIIYACRFEECRYVICKLFYENFNICRQRTENLRIHVYSIVVTETRHRSVVAPGEC